MRRILHGRPCGISSLAGHRYSVTALATLAAMPPGDGIDGKLGPAEGMDRQNEMIARKDNAVKPGQFSGKPAGIGSNAKEWVREARCAGRELFTATVNKRAALHGEKGTLENRTCYMLANTGSPMTAWTKLSTKSSTDAQSVYS